MGSIVFVEWYSGTSITKCNELHQTRPSTPSASGYAKCTKWTELHQAHQAPPSAPSAPRRIVGLHQAYQASPSALRYIYTERIELHQARRRAAPSTPSYTKRTKAIPSAQQHTTQRGQHIVLSLDHGLPGPDSKWCSQASGRRRASKQHSSPSAHTRAPAYILAHNTAIQTHSG